MNAGIAVGVVAGDGDERRGDAGVAFIDEEHLGGVAPPAVWVREVGGELLERFIEHAGLWAGLFAIGHEAVDAAVTHDFGHAPLFDAMVALDPIDELVFAISFDVASFHLRADLGGEPFLFLNDAAIHVGDVKAAVGAVFGPHWAEIGVGAANELALRIDVVRDGEAAFALEAAEADEAAHGLTCGLEAVKLGHQRAAQNRLATAGGEAGEDVLLFEVVTAGGVVPDFADGVGRAVAFRMLAHAQHGIARGKLEALRGIRTASACAIEMAIVIAGEAPLAEAAIGVIDGLELAIVAQAEADVVGGDDVVEVPKDAGALVLDVAVVGAGFEDEFLAI